MGEGFISKKQEEILSSVSDFGSSAVHRKNVPKMNDVCSALHISDVLFDMLITSRISAKMLQKNTPNRDK